MPLFDEVAGDVGVGLAGTDHEDRSVFLQAALEEGFPSEGVHGDAVAGDIRFREDLLGGLHSDALGDAELVAGELPLTRTLHGRPDLSEDFPLSQDHGFQARGDPEQVTDGLFAVEHHGTGHEGAHVLLVRLEGLEELLEPSHAEVGLIDQHELHPVAGRQVGDALDSELFFEARQEGLLPVLGHMQAPHLVDGGVPVVEGNNMEVLLLHDGQSSVTLADSRPWTSSERMTCVTTSMK